MARKPDATVLVVADRRLFADGLRAALDAHRGLRAVGSAANPLEAAGLAGKHKPDVILIDTEIPGIDAPQFVRSLRAVSADSAIVALIDRQSDVALAQVVEAGAVGYVQVTQSAEQVADAVKRAAAGEALLGAQEARRLLGVLRHRRVQRASARQRADRLTPREVEILQYMAKGLRAGEMAETLGLSPYTVRTHVHNVLTKLGARSKAEAVAFAMQEGKVSLRR